MPSRDHRGQRRSVTPLLEGRPSACGPRLVSGRVHCVSFLLLKTWFVSPEQQRKSSACRVLLFNAWLIGLSPKWQSANSKDLRLRMSSSAIEAVDKLQSEHV